MDDEIDLYGDIIDNVNVNTNIQVSDLIKKNKYIHILKS